LAKQCISGAAEVFSSAALLYRHQVRAFMNFLREKENAVANGRARRLVLV